MNKRRDAFSGPFDDVETQPFPLDAAEELELSEGDLRPITVRPQEGEARRIKALIMVTEEREGRSISRGEALRRMSSVGWQVLQRKRRT